MYCQGHPQNLYHVRKYGHPSQFGYKDICKLWKAERFNPDELMSLYHKAGARYFVAQAMHHDHFFNYASKLNKFNSVNIGPMTDICMMWKKAASKFSLPFGLSEHLGAAFTWWKTNKWHDTYGCYKDIPYDGNDPEYQDFYFDNYECVSDDRSLIATPWYTTNKKFHEYWLSVMKEVIDMFQPDILYSDGALPFGTHWEPQYVVEKMSVPGDPCYHVGLEAVSYYYNKSIALHGRNNAVYLQKDRRPEIYCVGVLDIEKSQLKAVSERPWHTDTCIGDWFYDVRQEYKSPALIIEILIDIVAKNGCMLLNILQKPDGTIDCETIFILEELANWFAVCGDAIYSTRPWRVYGEGDSCAVIEDFREDKTSWNSSDFRFTAKDNKLYAFILKAPENNIVVIKSLTETDRVSSVKLMGGGQLEFNQSFGILTVKLAKELPTEYTNCLEIIL